MPQMNMQARILSSDKLATWELCNRRFQWQSHYHVPRISVIGALYRSLDAGLRGKDPERAAENEFMTLAANPGLDVVGRDVFSIAMHHSKLAGIIAVALRSAFTAPWGAFPDAEIGNSRNGVYSWRSACYDAGDGIPRRVVLVDRWSDDRKAAECRNWRTLGEALALRKPVLVTALVIGGAREGRRHSAWTRCYRHPRNRTFRFKRKSAAEDFGANWEQIWRENSDATTADWLTRMRKDDCMGELVQTVQVPPPARRDAFVYEIQRIAEEMEQWEERKQHPPMRLAGCYPIGQAQCPFICVCHGNGPAVLENYGFRETQGCAA